MWIPDLTRDLLYRYSEWSVDRKARRDAVTDLYLERLGAAEQFQVSNRRFQCRLLYQRQPWESEYFGRPTVRLETALFDQPNYADLVEAIARFSLHLRAEGVRTVYTEVPCEDALWIQSLNRSGYRIVETRLHYHHNRLPEFHGERYSIREATAEDIPNLCRVAMQMRNEHDRFHADVAYQSDVADVYLATYVEQSIRGFTDLVVVPDEPGVPADSFVTANLNQSVWPRLGHHMAKMVLSAVSSRTNRGWFYKLVSSRSHWLIERGAESIFMNTQAANIAALHTFEKLGYRLGGVTHLLTADLADDGPRL